MKTNDTAQSPKDLLEELRSLVKEAESLVAESLGEQSEETLASLRDRFAAAQERFSDFYAGARKKVVDGAHRTDEAIRDNPYQSLAIAAGVGLLIGVLLGRQGK